MQGIKQMLRGPIKAHTKALSFFSKSFSTVGGGGGDGDGDGEWGGGWSTGLTQEHLDGEVVGRPVGPEQPRFTDREVHVVKELQAENQWSKDFLDSWDRRLTDTTLLLNQAREPGLRGSYLKDSEKAEMYKKHKANPEVYTVERLAKEYRIMRQRVHAILYLKEDEEKEVKRLGKPLDDTVELLLDALPECFQSHDREFHVANLPRKPNFKVMPEGWDGTTRDPDEVHYEISMKEDEQMYEEFVLRMNYNKMRMASQVKVHKYSRRRPSEGWNFMVEKLGSRGKRGKGAGWKFMSQADGSSRPLNEYEMMFVKREKQRRRQKISP